MWNHLNVTCLSWATLSTRRQLWQYTAYIYQYNRLSCYFSFYPCFFLLSLSVMDTFIYKKWQTQSRGIDFLSISRKSIFVSPITYALSNMFIVELSKGDRKNTYIQSLRKYNEALELVSTDSYWEKRQEMAITRECTSPQAIIFDFRVSIMREK